MQVGQVVVVAAWWNRDKPVRCKIREANDTRLYVQPLEGNPHMRYVRPDAVIRVDETAIEADRTD